MNKLEKIQYLLIFSLFGILGVIFKLIVEGGKKIFSKLGKTKKRFTPDTFVMLGIVFGSVYDQVLLGIILGFIIDFAIWLFHNSNSQNE